MMEFIIERNQPIREGHPLAQASVMQEVSAEMGQRQGLVRLVDYLQDFAEKPRGTVGGNTDLNSHFEDFIIRDSKGIIRVASLSELQDRLRAAGLDIELLGVQSMGNANQRIEATVQGLSRANPKSGYERPVLIEGPHMILAPFAIDESGQLHLFRTIQYRTGEAEIDTPRGFADAESLANGQQMYEVDAAGERVTANMQRIVGEESGDALQIKRVVYLGSPRVNGSFVPADKSIGEGRSAVFAVEVDYKVFRNSQKLVTEAELQRRREQEEHEGLTGDILDITLSQYVDYKRNSSLAKDMAADFGTDTVVIDFLERGLTDLARKEQEHRRQLAAEGPIHRRDRLANRGQYVEDRLEVSKRLYPERAEENDRRAREYLSRLHRGALDKTS